MVVYENEIMNTRVDNSVIPSFAPVSEMGYYVLEANEQDFYSMMERIGLNELAVFEATGNVVLYEEGSKDSKVAIGEKVGFFTKVWARVKAMFEKVMRAIREVITKVSVASGKKALDNKKLKDAIAKLPNNYTADYYAGYDTTLNDYVVGNIRLVGVGDPEKDIAALKKMFDTELITVDVVRKKVRGEAINIDKNYITDRFQLICDTVKNFDKTDKDLKSMFKDAKSAFDNILKLAKKNEGDNKDKIVALKDLAQVRSIIYNVSLNEYYSKVRTYCKIVVDLNRASKKEESKAKNEAATISGQYASVDSEIASMFAW